MKTLLILLLVLFVNLQIASSLQLGMNNFSSIANSDNEFEDEEGSEDEQENEEIEENV